MHYRCWTIAAWLILAASPGVAQVGSVITGAGYQNPAPIQAAPGQIITVFVDGIGRGLTEEVRAVSNPLPTMLGGVSVSMQESDSRSPILVPLLSVVPLRECSGVVSLAECSPLVAITMQVPFELDGANPLDVAPGAQRIGKAILTVSEHGLAGRPYEVALAPDAIHVLTSCDSGASSENECTPIVTHADGAPVSAMNPARGKETLIVYAYGLGVTESMVRSGERSPNDLRPTVGQFQMAIDFHVNAPVRWPVRLDSSPSTSPSPLPPGITYAGLTPGYVGLYQVNFMAPDPPSELPPCGGSVRSNLTVSIGGLASSDGGGICIAVEPPITTLEEGAATQATIPSENATPAVGAFTPNFVAYPEGADLRHLAQPVPPESGGLPPAQTRGVTKP